MAKSCSHSYMPNYLIKNATVIDGSGTDRFQSDIRIADERVAEINSTLHQQDNEIVIDASGLIASPGFIDTHTHSDVSILAAPEATGKISQGITTDITGNCGLSVFPITDKNRDSLQKLYGKYNINLDWSTFKEYRERVATAVPAINISPLCGHNTLRSAIAGYDCQDLNRDQLQMEKELLKTTLSEGASGFSTGLVYSPGKFSTRDELEELLTIAASFEKPYTTHLRNEGDTVVEALTEAIELSQSSGIQKLHVSHLKASRRSNWDKLDKMISLIESNQSNNLQISADRYPYTETMTQLSIILPEPYDSMPDAAIEQALQNTVAFNELIQSLKHYSNDRWENARLVSTDVNRYKQYCGKSIAEIAATVKEQPSELVAMIIRDNSTGTMAAFKGLCPDNLEKIVMKDWICCGSDETARPVNLSLGTSHPRGFGSFPRYINMSLAQGFKLEEIIRKITSQPASIFNLAQRGLITKGYFADITLFDPDKLQDMATFDNPHSISEGIEYVFVNGALSYEIKKVTQRNGRVI